MEDRVNDLGNNSRCLYVVCKFCRSERLNQLSELRTHSLRLQFPESLPEVQYPKPLRADKLVHDDLEHVVKEVLGIVLVDVGLHEVVAEVVPSDGVRKNVLEDGVDNAAFDVVNESGLDDARFENVWEDGSSSAVGRIVGEIVSNAVEGMFEVVFGTQVLMGRVFGFLWNVCRCMYVMSDFACFCFQSERLICEIRLPFPTDLSKYLP